MSEKSSGSEGFHVDLEKGGQQMFVIIQQYTVYVHVLYTAELFWEEPSG